MAREGINDALSDCWNDLTARWMGKTGQDWDTDCKAQNKMSCRLHHQVAVTTAILYRCYTAELPASSTCIRRIAIADNSL